VTTDGSGNVYVTGFFSSNAFKISPPSPSAAFLDVTGDALD
jgi:hypothetical protein